MLVVVDDFEVVEVERHEVQGVPGGRCVRKRSFWARLAISPVLQAGKRIKNRQAIEVICLYPLLRGRCHLGYE